MDFGPANYQLSANLSNSIINYQSRNHEGRIYRFSKKSSRLLANRSRNEYWECMDCKRIKRQNGAEINEFYSSIIVRENRIIKNPDIEHHRDCEGETFGRSNAKVLVRESRNMCKLGHKRPLEAHTAMNSELAKHV